MTDIKLPDIVNPDQLSKDDEGNGGINIGHFFGVWKKNQSKQVLYHFFISLFSLHALLLNMMIAKARGSMPHRHTGAPPPTPFDFFSGGV